ncbi:MAG: sensor histidine kinase [Thiotrichales bacterium]
MHSIGTRIAVGFFALVSLIVILAVFTYGDLRYLERQIRQGVSLSALVEQVMEMRRYEKNYFLYGGEEELRQALAFSAAAAAMVAKNAQLLAKLCAKRPCAALSEELTRYQAALGQIDIESSFDHAAGDDAVRAAGHRLTELAQSLGQREREYLSASVEQSGRWWLSLAVGIGLLGATLGILLARVTVRPLRQLEANLAPLAEGRFNTLRASSRDREIQSFASAFNRTLMELDNRRRQLVHSEKLASLGVLVAGVAHELNNPLSNSSIACQLALEEIDTASREQLAEWLKQIDIQTRRAQRIVLALSDYARRRPLTLERINVTEIFDQTLVLVRKHLGPQVTIEHDLPHNYWVRSDRQRLQQILINLLKNAVDADSDGHGVTITLSARLLGSDKAALPGSCLRLGKEPGLSSADDHILITVSDTGPGMVAEVLDRIFDPFFTTRAVGKGMGLGLYIVQEIVHELDGCIGVESKPGSGTCFMLVLPGGSDEAHP